MTKSKLKNILSRIGLGIVTGWLGFGAISVFQQIVSGGKQYSLLYQTGYQAFLYIAFMIPAFILIDLNKPKSIKSIIAYVLMGVALIIKLVGMF